MAAPLKIAELDHVVLRCTDPNRMLEFYTRVLGLTEERRIEQMGLVQLRAGASMIDLIPTYDGLQQNTRNVDHFCLGIEAEDMGAVAAYLGEQSVQVLGQPEKRYGARGSGLSIYILDPEGNIVELKQMPRATS
jgi:glyoxylase I family protein